MATKFDPGRLCWSRGINERIAENKHFARFAWVSLARHSFGDWGDVCPEDREANNQAIEKGGRIFSRFDYDATEKIWIITEADRSSTMILYPSEY